MNTAENWSQCGDRSGYVAAVPNHYSGIDGLRALAVVSVVFYHAFPGGLGGGFVGVDVFFVISGFVVSLSMARAPTRSFAAFGTAFYARRLLRIGPALIVCLLVTSMLTCLFVPHAWLSETNADTGLAAFFGVSNLVLARTANDYFSPRAEFNPFTHTWSLGIEEQFYLVFPLLMYFFIRDRGAASGARWSWRTLILVSGASLAVCAWWSANRPAFAFYLIPARFWELAAGVALFMSIDTWKPRLSNLSQESSRRACFGLLALLLGSMIFAAESSFPFPWALLPVACTAGLIAMIVACGSSALPTIFSNGIVLYVGAISYSLYLWHWPILVLFRWTTGLEGLTQKFTALTLAFVVAGLSSRYVEKPLRYAKSIRLLPHRTVVVSSFAVVALAAGAAGLVFRLQSNISLSVTTDSETWLPDGGIEPAGASAPLCEVVVRWRPLEGGGILDYQPSRCAAANGSGRLFVAGDSHAWAYSALLRMYAERSGREVHIITKGGCSLFDLQAPMASAVTGCRRFSDAVMRELSQVVAPGDVLFLPSLRVPRFIDQWGATRIIGSAATELTSRQEAMAEAVALLRPLANEGIHILFEAPKPIFRSPPFRCSDWFNRGNPVCAAGFEIDRLEMDQVRRPALASIHNVIAQVTGAAVWDPMPTLCPSHICNAYADGRPLYFDGDHLSGFGNAILFQAFDNRLGSAFPSTGRQAPPK
ncbi:MAG: acyltransferase [Acidobacteriota bacterium]|nr:acyltransferase [Acidobacteriota bacterium]